MNRSAASNSGFTVFSQLENYAEPSLFFVFMSLHVTSQKSFLYVSTKWQFNAKNVRFVESCRCMHLIHSTEISGSQCGDYENSLSRIFGKNFVKVTVLLTQCVNDGTFAQNLFYKLHFINFIHKSLLCKGRKASISKSQIS